MRLILSLDADVFHAAWTSIRVSVWSILFASLLGIPIGLAAGMSEFAFKRMVLTLLNTLIAVPTVLVGLLVYGFLSRQGPLGHFGLLFTPGAMVIGGTILITPIVANYSLNSAKGADRRILATALTLGAGRLRSTMKFVSEIRFGILAAVIAGFGRVISEVGVAMILGGNIRGYTRTMTTAIALETSQGKFAEGVALGVVLMAVALLVNVFLSLLQQRRR